jgi:DNA-binding transcriptional ArsR family regulator
VPAKSTRRPQRVLTDPRAIRALAHPARLAVLDVLSDGGDMTATECAQAAGVSPSAMSYHLRALEKWGFVERAPAGSDGRERPWRSVGHSWRIDDMSDHVAAAAANAVVSAMLDRLRTNLSVWFEREHDQPKRWRDVAAIENSNLWLTTEEAKEIEDLYRDFIDRHSGRTAEDHPEGARRVHAVRALIPLQFD